MNTVIKLSYFLLKISFIIPLGYTLDKKKTRLFPRPLDIYTIMHPQTTLYNIHIGVSLVDIPTQNNF